MKITRKDNNEVDFCTLTLGDVFKNDDDIFMAIREVENKKGGFYNAVNMETGELTIFYADEKVFPLQAELIVS
jgi:hypothetical protein